jgi:tetratricopeptide (TPR) repeat protein
MRSKSMRLRQSIGTALTLALSALAACASAGKRYEQGLELEQRGRPADAAQRYVDALKKDPTLADARARLLDTGSRAVADYVAQADAQESGARYADAADLLRKLDDLRGDAAGVGVPLQPPTGYEQRRRDTFDRAVDQAVSESDGAITRGDFSGAVDWLDRATRRWEPTPAARDRLEHARSDAFLAWAKGELAAGHFRAAYDRAAQAAAITGAADAAATLQQDALRRGTVRVAILPVGGRAAARDRLPDDLFAELNDELSINYWSRSPLWLDVVDPVAAGREARRHGAARQPIEPAQGAQIGRTLGARIVVVMEVDSVRRTEGAVQSQRRTARIRSGADTAYTIHEGRVETWARVTYRVVDASGWGRIADAGSVTASSGATFRRAEYHGDWRTLALSSGDRALFETPDRAPSRETVRELVSGLSTRLGRDVYETLLRRIE